jgi:hypothetical protein
MINHFASICETKVACRNYLNIILPFWVERTPFSCSHTRVYAYTEARTQPTYSYSMVLVKLKRESIVSLFRSGRCYKLREFIVSRAQSNLKDSPGEGEARAATRQDRQTSLTHN